MIQVQLKRGDERQIVWVDRLSLKKGDQCTFKGEQEWWIVENVYSDCKKEKSQINTKWNVGGL